MQCQIIFLLIIVTLELLHTFTLLISIEFKYFLNGISPLEVKIKILFIAFAMHSF